ncbi:type II secretion system protein [bacterium]|nr:type II secretion system protein [bacterium]
MKNRKRAFSLVELMIAFLILGFLFVTMMSSMTRGTKNTLDSVDKMVASNALFSIMENLTNRSFKNIKSNFSTWNFTIEKTISNQNYTITSEIDDLGESNPAFILIKLEASWSNGKKRLRLGKILSENEN